MSPVIRKTAGGLGCALLGVLAVEAIITLGFKSSHPLLLPCFAMIVGAYLFAVPGGVAGALGVIGYMLFAMARPDHFPGFLGFNLLALWLVGIPFTAVLVGVLRARADRAQLESLRVAEAEAKLRSARMYEQQLRDSEERFRSLAELSSDWYWEQDEQFRFVSMADDSVQKPDARPPGFIGRTRWDLGDTSLTPKEWAEHRARLGRHEEFRNLEYSRMSSDGKLRWVSVSGRPIVDGDGRFRGYRGFGRDITAQKLAEQALRDSEARLRAIFERTNAGVALIGTDGRFLAVNAGYANFVGWSATELVGVHTDRVRCPEDEEGRKLFPRMVAGEIGNLLRDRCYLRKDGGRVWGRLSMTAVRGASGMPQYFVVVVTDITEARAARERMQQMNVELERRVAERTAALQATLSEVEAFSYTISHDLRAPLRAINGFARLLRDEESGKLSAEGNRLLEVVEKNARDMASLVDGLLEFSRLGRQAMARVRVSMQRLADEVVAELAAPEAQIRVGALPDCLGDPMLLRQVWANLLSNAHKYSRNRAPQRIEIGHDGAAAAYFVRDNGLGFDMQYADKLFGVFQRLHNDPKYEGTGVGLAIVNRIVHRHGGRIWAQARPGEGATFYFTLGSGENAPS